MEAVNHTKTECKFDWETITTFTHMGYGYWNCPDCEKIHHISEI